MFGLFGVVVDDVCLILKLVYDLIYHYQYAVLLPVVVTILGY